MQKPVTVEGRRGKRESLDYMAQVVQNTFIRPDSFWEVNIAVQSFTSLSAQTERRA